MEKNREIWIDWLRVAACFMVFIVHSTEPFYLGGQGALILSETDAFWASFFDSFVRSCVPLFIIASSYLQFPTRYSAVDFFKRRAVRVIIPFLIWTAVYAFVWGEPVENFKNLLLNFNYAAGHLWFVYMILGIYVKVVNMILGITSLYMQLVIDSLYSRRLYVPLCFSNFLNIKYPFIKKKLLTKNGAYMYASRLVFAV